MRLAAILITMSLVISSGLAQDEKASTLLGDYHDGSQCPHVHQLTLYDVEGFRIFPGMNEDTPFAQRITCGKCHDVGTIGDGWHFRGGDQDGRPGEPWVYWDASLATQIPLSERAWPGVFEPNQLGLTDWWMVQAFGRHMPGGISAPSKEDQHDPRDNWAVSGDFEINCLTCHNAAAGHDQSQVAEQTGLQNFAWSGTATCEFAHVTGAARNPARTWEDGVTAQEGPQVQYDESRFFADNQVQMDIRRSVPNQRCLFCHSSQTLGGHGMHTEDDVHIAAGMACVDCHKHGLGHQMVRGYENEAVDANDSERFALSCKGCHLGSDDHGQPTAGALTAPYPVHKGIPTVHFERLSCTACHSGPWPQTDTVGVKTARAHALGTRRVNRTDDTLPHIQMPVFQPGTDGKIAPHKLLWPSYWAWLKDDAVTPMTIEAVKVAAQGILPRAAEMESSTWPALTDAMISAVLANMQGPTGEPVYISGGLLYRLTNGAIETSEHEAADAVTWPMAHNVRPAEQSLGVRSCQDCHLTQAGMLFGGVPLDGPLADPNQRVAMTQYHGLNAVYNKLFAQTFVFRPMLKLVSFFTCALIGLVLVTFLMRAVLAVTRALKQ